MQQFSEVSTPTEPRITEEQFKQMVIEDIQGTVRLEALREDALCQVWLRCLFEIKIEAEYSLSDIRDGAYSRKNMTMEETLEYDKKYVEETRNFIALVDKRILEARNAAYYKNRKSVMAASRPNITPSESVSLLKENNKRLHRELQFSQNYGRNLTDKLDSVLSTLSKVNNNREQHRESCTRKRLSIHNNLQEITVDRSLFRHLITQLIMRWEDKEVDDEFIDELKLAIGWDLPYQSTPIRMRPPKSFRLWLRIQVGRTDAIGIFARASMQDKCWVSTTSGSSIEAVRTHLTEVHNATRVVLEVLELAYNEYMQVREEIKLARQDLSNIYAELG